MKLNVAAAYKTIGFCGTAAHRLCYRGMRGLVRAETSEVELEQRFRERAFQIWLDKGLPKGGDKEHWELAKFAISQQTAMDALLIPPGRRSMGPSKRFPTQERIPDLVEQDEGSIPGAKPERYPLTVVLRTEREPMRSSKTSASPAIAADAR